MTTDVSKTLAERGARYGQFIDHATIAQGLQEVLHEAPNWYRLQPDVRQMCIVITDKIARILNGDPDYTDNYHDIQGYAKLVEQRLLREEEAKKAKLFDNPPDISKDQKVAEPKRFPNPPPTRRLRENEVNPDQYNGNPR